MRTDWFLPHGCRRQVIAVPRVTRRRLIVDLSVSLQHMQPGFTVVSGQTLFFIQNLNEHCSKNLNDASQNVSSGFI